MERRTEVHHPQTTASEPIARPSALILPSDMVPATADVDEPQDDRRAMRGASSRQTDRLLERLGHRRIAEIRARLASGVYGSREVIAALTVRMLESGDLA